MTKKTAKIIASLFIVGSVLTGCESLKVIDLSLSTAAMISEYSAGKEPEALPVSTYRSESLQSVDSQIWSFSRKLSEAENLVRTDKPIAIFQLEGLCEHGLKMQLPPTKSETLSISQTQNKSGQSTTLFEVRSESRNLKELTAVLNTHARGSSFIGLQCASCENGVMSDDFLSKTCQTDLVNENDFFIRSSSGRVQLLIYQKSPQKLRISVSSKSNSAILETSSKDIVISYLNLEFNDKENQAYCAQVIFGNEPKLRCTQTTTIK